LSFPEKWTINSENVHKGIKMKFGTPSVLPFFTVLMIKYREKENEYQFFESPIFYFCTI